VCFFTQPEIVDVTDKTVRVRYVNTGSRDLETKAMQLIAKHCGQGGFRVTNRTVQATYRNVSGNRRRSPLMPFACKDACLRHRALVLRIEPKVSTKASVSCAKKSAWTPIVLLFNRCSPAAVRRFVVAVHVDAVERVAFRSFAISAKKLSNEARQRLQTRIPRCRNAGTVMSRIFRNA
jgi:hypothetical protein